MFVSVQSLGNRNLVVHYDLHDNGDNNMIVIINESDYYGGHNDLNEVHDNNI